MKRRKSIVSQAASISAWWAVFDWFSIVAAFSVERHGPASSSAARRKTATRSCQGVAAHSACGFRAAAIARSTWEASPFATSASTCVTIVRHDRLEGRAFVSTRSPPITSGIDDALARHLGQPAVQVGALGRAGGIRPHRLVDGGWHAEDRRERSRGRL